MKSYLIQTLFISLCSLCVDTLNAQTLSQQSINTMGAYMTSSSSSLSQTVGETMTATWTQGDKILTQGFHQTFMLTLNLKAFLQGYYQENGIMNDVLYNQGVSAMPTSLTDSITIECRKPFYPFDRLFQEKKCISNNGLVTISHQGLIGEKVYIVLKHRNSLETWSALPIIIEQHSFYDFTTAANKAFADNQAEVEPGIFALYAGDINQDGYIDGFDYPAYDSDVQNNVSGVYVNTDLNGDGYVDGFDYPLFDENSQNNVSVITP